MASTSAHRNGGKLRKSHYQPTVCLADWWLTKSGNELAVAGFSSHEKQAVRVFSSGPILKRYSVFNVETTDGICVILDGFINKDRTLENGFPSDVFNYFVFGFPPNWKEYYEKLMGKESSSKDISANLPKKPLPCPGMVGGQAELDWRETDFSSQGKMNAKGIGKSKRTKTSSIPLSPQRCGREIGASEDNLNMPSITSEAPQKEFYSGGRSGEDHTTPELSVNNLKDKIKSVSGSICELRTIVPAVTENDVEYAQIDDSRGILSACHLYKGRRKRATDNSKKVETRKNNSMKANLDRGLSLSEDRPTEKMQLRFSCAGSDSYGFDQVPETPKQNKDMGKIKTRNKQAKNKASKSLDSPAAADNQTDKTKNSTSKKAKISTVKTRRKSALSIKETSHSGKEKVPSASPQLSSLNRSRSGRLLMPTLEFWRNQIPVYDKSGTITGIEEGAPLSVPKIGSSQKERKRKQPA